MTATDRPTVPSEAELDALRELAIAVLADRLYILGSKQWANPELVARWNSEATPGTILQIARELKALRAERDALHGALRKHAISDGICYQCGTVWEYLAECEQHAPGCLAAPREEEK